jgi:hypothetical protein
VSHHETPKDTTGVKSTDKSTDYPEPADPRLKAILTAWESLSEAMKDAVAQMVKASEGR